MTRETGASLVVRALEDEGVPFAFGIPGAQNLELYDELDRSARVRPILVTDEQSASFMADGVSRASGRLGCVNLVPGAGLTHALSGIAESHMDGIPLLVLAAGIRSDTGKAFQLHAVDQLGIAKPVTKAQIRIDDGADLYGGLRRACRLAQAPPAGPVIVEIPANLLVFRHAARGAETTEPDPAPGPPAEALERVCGALSNSRRPLLYLGLGSAAAGAGLSALAERLEAPVATTIQGKGVFPESHPLWLWCGFGPAAPGFVRDIAADCDAVLALGCRFAEVATGSYGLEMPGPLIHVDIDPAVFDRNYPAAVAAEAEAGAFVAALLQRLPERQRDDRLRAAIRAGHEKVRAGWGAPPETGHGVAPPRLFGALQAAYGPDALWAVDSGNGLFEAMECLRIDRPGSFLAPVDFSCMGYCVPAAIGAALAVPERPVVAVTGDGAFLMTGLELMTAAQLRLPLSVVVLRDRELAQIAQFQDIAFAQKTASELYDFDLALLCRGLGVAHIGVETEGALAEALADARGRHRAGEPVVLEVAVDGSAKTYFTRGVVRTNFGRLPWAERLRFVARALGRRIARRG